MKPLDQLRIDLANESDEVRSMMLGRMLGFVNKQVENGKDEVSITEFYKHLHKMYNKFGKVE